MKSSVSGRMENPEPMPHETMRAVVTDGYGMPNRLKVIQVPRPSIREHEVLVRVCAAAVCRADTYLLAGKPYLLRLSGYGPLRPLRPIPGQSFSGVIVEVGSRVSAHQVGDSVYGEVSCGAFAEFVACDSALLAFKPSKSSHAEAAALALSGITALQGLRDVARLQPGESVLINGASGSVGTLAVQIAKALGASVTAVCSTRHVELMRRLGADEIVDYTQHDYTRLGKRYDVLFDLVANHTLRDNQRALKPKGRFVAAAIPQGRDWVGPVTWLLKLAIADALSTSSFTSLFAKPNRADLEDLARMVYDGLLHPLVERRYDMFNVAQAYAHVASGHSQGSSVMEVS
ncbi:MAG: NAD(P)-dependent alcohol dehydrogenase [Pseudomonadota bacterium]